MDDKEKFTIIKEYRHNTITKFLNNVLDIDLKSAEYNAEQMENSMTDEVLTRLVNFMDYIEQCTSAKISGETTGKCNGCAGCCCSDKK